MVCAGTLVTMTSLPHFFFLNLSLDEEEEISENESRKVKKKKKSKKNREGKGSKRRSRREVILERAVVNVCTGIDLVSPTNSRK